VCYNAAKRLGIHVSDLPGKGWGKLFVTIPSERCRLNLYVIFHALARIVL
jgi:hypothetical protein